MSNCSSTGKHQAAAGHQAPAGQLFKRVIKHQQDIDPHDHWHEKPQTVTREVEARREIAKEELKNETILTLEKFMNRRRPRILDVTLHLPSNHPASKQWHIYMLLELGPAQFGKFVIGDGPNEYGAYKDFQECLVLKRVCIHPKGQGMGTIVCNMLREYSACILNRGFVIQCLNNKFFQTKLRNVFGVQPTSFGANCFVFPTPLDEALHPHVKEHDLDKAFCAEEERDRKRLKR